MKTRELEVTRISTGQAGTATPADAPYWYFTRNGAPRPETVHPADLCHLSTPLAVSYAYIHRGNAGDEPVYTILGRRSDCQTPRGPGTTEHEVRAEVNSGENHAPRIRINGRTVTLTMKPQRTRAAAIKKANAAAESAAAMFRAAGMFCSLILCDAPTAAQAPKRARKPVYNASPEALELALKLQVWADKNGIDLGAVLTGAAGVDHATLLAAVAAGSPLPPVALPEPPAANSAAPTGIQHPTETPELYDDSPDDIPEPVATPLDVPDAASSPPRWFIPCPEPLDATRYTGEVQYLPEGVSLHELQDDAGQVYRVQMAPGHFDRWHREVTRESWLNYLQDDDAPQFDCEPPPSFRPAPKEPQGESMQPDLTTEVAGDIARVRQEFEELQRRIAAREGIDPAPLFASSIAPKVARIDAVCYRVELPGEEPATVRRHPAYGSIAGFMVTCDRCNGVYSPEAEPCRHAQTVEDFIDAGAWATVATVSQPARLPEPVAAIQEDAREQQLHGAREALKANAAATHAMKDAHESARLILKRISSCPLDEVVECIDLLKTLFDVD